MLSSKVIKKRIHLTSIRKSTTITRTFEKFTGNLKHISKPLDVSEGDINLSSNRVSWQNDNISSSTNHILEQDSKYFIHQTLSTPCLNSISECFGIYLRDSSGNLIMDFHGNSVHHLGFNNKYIIDSITEQFNNKLSFCTRRYTNKHAIELASKLSSISPMTHETGINSRILFTPNGSCSNSIAIKIASIVTKKTKIISFWDSFHGANIDLASYSGETLFRNQCSSLSVPGSCCIPPFDSTNKCLFGCEGNCNLKCANYLEYILEREGDTVAALIAEPIRWGGYIPTVEYWKKIRGICDKYGIFLIFDEIPFSLGRTGDGWFTCNSFDIVPDIIVLGKALGGGILPLSAIIMRGEYNEFVSHTSLGHYTHEKNPTLCAAGIATLKYIENNDLIKYSHDLGIWCINEIQNQIQNNSKFSDIVYNVRGKGLLICIELRDKDHDINENKSNILVEKIMYQCLTNGLSFKISMGNVITLCPPLIITKEEIQKALDIIKISIETVLADNYK